MKFTLVLAQGSSRRPRRRSMSSPTSCRRSASRSRASTIRRRSSARSASRASSKPSKHPNADKLQVVQVEVEKGRPLFEVVCGAPNARAGMIGVFAPLGTYIPGIEDHAREEAGARRRVERHDVLGGRAGAFGRPRGHHRSAGRDGRAASASATSTSLASTIRVFEVKLTPNRPDCTGVRGIARDLAAAGLGTLKPEKTISGVEGDVRVPDRQ